MKSTATKLFAMFLLFQFGAFALKMDINVEIVAPSEDRAVRTQGAGLVGALVGASSPWIKSLSCGTATEGDKAGWSVVLWAEAIPSPAACFQLAKC